MSKLSDFDILCYSVGGSDSPPYYRATESFDFPTEVEGGGAEGAAR